MSITGYNMIKVGNVTIYSGIGLPPPQLGRKGDLFVRTDSPTVYIHYGVNVGWDMITTNGFTGSFGLRGYTGSHGFTGSRGVDGFGVRILGSLNSTTELPTTGNEGDAYLIGGSLWIWNPMGGNYVDAGNYKGETGYTGSQGEIGYTGSIGGTGYVGSRGFSGSFGDTGYTGSRGDTGFVGSTGTIGYTGSIGIGFTGSQGEIGFSGSRGLQGFTGSQGNIGYTGSSGFVGSQGIQGAVGFTGSQGFTGSRGATGFTGSVGFVGSTGFTGSVGFVGSTGNTGFTGSRGTDGTSVNILGSFNTVGELPATGNLGDAYLVGGNLYVWNGTTWQNVGQIQGPQGIIGFTGSRGFNGSAGFSGSRGYTGSQGIIGFTGSIGFSGSVGFSGSRGFSGSVGFTGSVGQSAYQAAVDNGYTGTEAEWIEALQGAKYMLTDTIVATAGVTRYTLDTNGAPLNVTQTNHVLFGQSPFGVYTQGVDYNVVDNGIDLMFIPEEGELMHMVKMPTINSSEAQAVLSNYKDEVQDILYVSVNQAQTAALDAQNSVPWTFNSLNAFRVSSNVFPIGSRIATKDGASFDIMAVGSSDFDIIHPVTGQLLKVVRRGSGWHVIDFSLGDISINMTEAFDKCKTRAMNDVLITPPGRFNMDYMNLYNGGSTYDFSASEIVCQVTGSQMFIRFIPISAGGGGRTQPTRIMGGLLQGPGRDSFPNTVGIYYHSTSGHPNAASDIILLGVSVRDFGHARMVGSNAYIFSAYDCKFMGNGTALYAPAGASNAGENVSDYHCTIANGTNGIDLIWAVHYHAYGCSFDFNTGIDFKVGGSGNIVIDGGHWEWREAERTGPKISTGSGVSGICNVILRDVTQYCPETLANDIPLIEGTNTVRFSGVRWLRLSIGRTISWSSTCRVIMEQTRLVGTPECGGDLGPQSYINRNYNLSVNNLNGYFLYGTGIGTRISATEFTNAKLSLTDWTSPTTTTGNSIRVEKGVGANNSQLRFLAKKDRDVCVHHLAFDVYDPNGAYAAAPFMYLYQYAVDILGYNTDGTPIYGDEQFVASFNLAIPTNVWSRRSISLLQPDVRKLPSWASHSEWRLFLTEMVGSPTGASQDGGRRSIYLSGFRVSSWGL